MMRKPVALAASLAVMFLGIFLLMRAEPPQRQDGEVRPSLYPGLDTAQVDGVSIRSGEDTVSLVRESGVWRVATENGFPADPSGIDQVLRTVAKLTSGDVITENREEHLLFEVDSAGAIDVKLTTGSATAARFLLGRSDPDFTGTYMRDFGNDSVILQPVSLRSIFDRKGNSWMSREILSLDEDRVKMIRIARGDEMMEFQNNSGNGWMVVSPEGYKPKGLYLHGLARGLIRLSAVGFGDADKREMAGLENPVAQVWIYLSDGTTRMLTIGAESGDGKKRFVKCDDNHVIYLVPLSRLAAVLGPFDDLIESSRSDKKEVRQ